ncbi:hypothetical protein NW066_04250 [Mycoplasmopsis felis]|nr:hypothetical protein [Mycoplasmopsis felis]UWV84786.1 hypothetical protein NW066_04250 [Mycoplasmopsis felis]
MFKLKLMLLNSIFFFLLILYSRTLSLSKTNNVNSKSLLEFIGL